MKNILIYDTYVFSRLGIKKLVSDNITDICCSVCADQANIHSITCNSNVDLVIVSVWDYQYIEEVIKAINPNVKVVIYYEYLIPVASIEKRYSNVVKLLSKQENVDEFLENIANLINPSTCKDTPIVELPSFCEKLLKSV